MSSNLKQDNNRRTRLVSEEVIHMVGNEEIRQAQRLANQNPGNNNFFFEEMRRQQERMEWNERQERERREAQERAEREAQDQERERINRILEEEREERTRMRGLTSRYARSPKEYNLESAKEDL